MNLELAKESYLSSKSEKRLSECTIKAYSIDLQQFVKYCEAEVNRGNIITADDVSSIGKTFLHTYLSKLNGQYKPKSTSGTYKTSSLPEKYWLTGIVQVFG